jgi:hypothetical protein
MACNAPVLGVPEPATARSNLQSIAIQKGVEMSTERRRWNLLVDGWSWKEAASAVADPEFQKRCEFVVSSLQESLDRTDGAVFLAADCAAAAFIRKQRVLRCEAANARIATFIAKERVQKVDEAIRESAGIVNSFPLDRDLDRLLKYESFCDRQFHKYMELIDRLWRRAEAQGSKVSREPTQLAVGAEADKESASGNSWHVPKEQN